MKTLLLKKWLLIVGLLSIVFLPTMLVLGIAMLPTLAALAVDRTKERFLAMGIGALNFCGCLPALVILWTEGQSLAVALGIVGDVMLWLIPYGASALGWLIYLSAQPVMASIYGATASQRLESLRERREKLVEVWGPAVTGADAAQASPGGAASAAPEEETVSPRRAAAR